MTDIFLTIAADPAGATGWQAQAPVLNDLLVVTGVVTAVIWLVLTVICVAVERGAIMRSLKVIGGSLRDRPSKLTSLSAITCQDHSRCRKQNTA